MRYCKWLEKENKEMKELIGGKNMKKKKGKKVTFKRELVSSRPEKAAYESMRKAKKKLNMSKAV